MNTDHRPTWQLPKGVSRGTWDYVTTPAIATEYDSFHGDHPLMRLDQQWIAQRIGNLSELPDRPRILIDLGCGTCRALKPWSDRGWRTIGIDLSMPMLMQSKSNFRSSKRPPGLIRANLAELECLASDFADAALCLYSSIGMIRGHEHRLAMLRAVWRALNSQGVIFIHVHNRGSWLRDPNGVRWTLQSWFSAWRDPQLEFGDRIYPYRDLPRMFLHIFSRRELERLLRQAGFSVESVIPLDRTSSTPLERPWYFPHLRAGGFLATATKVVGTFHVP